MSESPVGFDAAKAEWNEKFAGRPYSLSDWNSLTFSEQQRYGMQECKTKGAIYTTAVDGRHLRVTVDLPVSLVGQGFSQSEARWLESALHKKLEETIHWVLVARTAECGS